VKENVSALRNEKKEREERALSHSPFRWFLGAAQRARSILELRVAMTHLCANKSQRVLHDWTVESGECSPGVSREVARRTRYGAEDNVERAECEGTPFCTTTNKGVACQVSVSAGYRHARGAP